MKDQVVFARKRGFLFLEALALITVLLPLLAPRPAQAQFESSAGAESAPTVAICPFENSSGSKENDWISHGAADACAALMSRRSTQGPPLRVLERSQLPKVLEELRLSLSGLFEQHENAPRLGQLLSATYLVVGRVTTEGDQLRLTGKFVKTETGEAVTESVTGSVAQAFYLQDLLAAKLWNALYPQNPVPLPAPVGTSSVAAAKKLSLLRTIASPLSRYPDREPGYSNKKAVYEQALVYLEECSNEAAQLGNIALWEGLLHFNLGDMEKTLACFERAAAPPADRTSQLDALAWTANVRRIQRQWAESKSAAQQVLKESPGHWLGHYVMARLCQREGDTLATTSHAIDALVANPEDLPTALLLHSVLTSKIEEIEGRPPREYWAECAKGLVPNPNPAAAWIAAECDFRSEKFVKPSKKRPGTLELVDVVLKRWPAFAPAHRLKGIVLAANKDLAGAEASLIRAINLNPSDALAHWHLANILDQTKRASRACDHYQMFILAAPLSPQSGELSLELRTARERIETLRKQRG